MTGHSAQQEPHRQENRRFLHSPASYGKTCLCSCTRSTRSRARFRKVAERVLLYCVQFALGGHRVSNCSCGNPCYFAARSRPDQFLFLQPESKGDHRICKARPRKLPKTSCRRSRCFAKSKS